MSPRFVLKDYELVHDLHHQGHDARLAVQIKDKPRAAKIELKHIYRH